MGFGYREYHLELWDELRQPENRLTNITQIEIRNSTAGTLLVSGTNLFADPEGQSGFTNPVTTISSDGHLKFFSSIDPIDVVVYMDDGRYVVYNNLSATDPKKHAIMHKNGAHLVYKIPFVSNDNTETDTGVDLPRGLIVTNCFAEVTVADVGETMDVGLLASESGGDANGLMAAGDIGTVGIILGPVGALLANTTLRSQEAVHPCDGVAESVSYTHTTGGDTGVGYIYIVGYLLPRSVNLAYGTA